MNNAADRGRSSGDFRAGFRRDGAIIINDVSGGAITHIGITLTVGLVVLVMISSLGDVPGYHLNRPSRSDSSLPDDSSRDGSFPTSRLKSLARSIAPAVVVSAIAVVPSRNKRSANEGTPYRPREKL